MVTAQPIRFKDRDDLMLIGPDSSYAALIGVPIATLEEFKSRTSYANLDIDGNIYRYGSIIGTKEDIEEVGEPIELAFGGA